MEQMTPQDLFIIIGLTGFVLLVSVLYDSRTWLAEWWRGVKPRHRTYGKSAVQEDDEDAPETPDSATDNESRNRIAIGRNERNDELLRNERLRVQAEAIAALLAADSLYIPDGRGGYKKAGQTLLVKLVTGLSANGRPESEYGKLRAELDQLMRPTMTVTEASETRRISK